MYGLIRRATVNGVKRLGVARCSLQPGVHVNQEKGNIVLIRLADFFIIHRVHEVRWLDMCL